MSVILRPDFPTSLPPSSPGGDGKALASATHPDAGAPHRIPISGATASDISLVAHSVDLIFNLAISALQGQLENLRENLPMSSRNNFGDVYAVMQDLRSDTLWRLEQLAEDR